MSSKNWPLGRRRILVNKRVQIGYALMVAWTVFVSISVTAITVYYTLASVAFNPANFSNLERAMSLADTTIFWRLCTVGLILVGCSMALTIYFMHRLVGPVYRFEQILRAAAAGSIPPEIKLRKNDEFKPLAAALLDMLQSVEKPPEPATESQPDGLTAPSSMVGAAANG